MLEATRVAVGRRMVADVPVGILLSGGLDSTRIVALLAESGQPALATFSVGSPDAGGREGDEVAFSDLVAREYGTDHHQIRVGVERLLPALGDAIAAMSEPMVSHDAVAFYLLSEEVARHRTVVQSGQGADEVFGGYHWNPPLLEAGRGSVVDVYSGAFFDRRDPELRALAPAAAAGDPSRRFAERFFSRPGAETPVDRGLRLDAEVMLVDDPVKRVDDMTMAHGLEARTPFLDHELVELAALCPPELELADGGKGVLKGAARGVVPDAVIDRPEGHFPVPALTHLEGPVLELVGEALRAPAARDRGLFDAARVEAMLAAPNEHRTNLDGSELGSSGCSSSGCRSTWAEAARPLARLPRAGGGAAGYRPSLGGADVVSEPAGGVVPGLVGAFSGESPLAAWATSLALPAAASLAVFVRSEGAGFDAPGAAAGFGVLDAAGFGVLDAAGFGVLDAAGFGVLDGAGFGALGAAAGFGVLDAAGFVVLDAAGFGVLDAAGLGGLDAAGFGALDAAGFGLAEVAGFGVGASGTDTGFGGVALGDAGVRGAVLVAGFGVALGGLGAAAAFGFVAARGFGALGLLVVAVALAADLARPVAVSGVAGDSTGSGRSAASSRSPRRSRTLPAASAPAPATFAPASRALFRRSLGVSGIR